ncbi:glycosyltransferase [Nocardia aurantia]|uniref:D-inositol-3-phosphate glycosyltransferase n=1 Tax=Nocardia aurantia TaxID=2585199 RepID=A0A7K0DGM9_9NOCA|nr:glycosyltransferase [Nocardia aurantia]MQY24829.1 D-inositol-3-phosphate glycosyltransferase [Nocardia aurantia]
MTPPRIALVHERFTEYGGSEAVVAEFMKTWPGAPVFAPLTTAECLDSVRTAAAPVEGEPATTFHTSRLTRAYELTGQRSHAPLLPLVPAALRRLPLADRFDTVVVSHHAFATQAVFATDAPVVAYVHSPARWAWDPAFRAREAGGRAGRAALTALGRLARHGELRAAPRLAHVVANSQAVAGRVRDWWGLPSTVVHPPVRIDRFAPDPTVAREDFFLIAGRLVPYKRADLAIRAAQLAGCRLIVLGEGRFRTQLESVAGPETTFLGAAPDEVLLDMYRRCRALLMPGVEDFGIVPVEAMACGTPVLAVGAGGAVDTVLPGISGEHVEFGDDTAVVTEFARAMRDFDPASYDPAVIRKHAESFSPGSFRRTMAEVVARVTVS